MLIYNDLICNHLLEVLLLDKCRIFKDFLFAKRLSVIPSFPLLFRRGHCKRIDLLKEKSKLTFLRFRLDELHKKDLAKAENERSKNSLETFLYEFRDKLDGETIEELSSEGEREKIRAKFSEISDWIDEEGFDSTADVSFTRVPAGVRRKEKQILSGLVFVVPRFYR